ncbi:MAG: polyprenol monophosphomannose synthase [Actinomycetota bacterium]|nr:polyprenol monophosphomannose synthase [Actinomycetota bacterium]
MRVLVVLPTFQEAANIDAVLRKLRGAVPEASILVVDDNSPDGTAEMAEKVGADVGAVDVLRRPGKAGLGSAYRDGFRWGLDRGFEAFVEMDSDLSHDPAAVAGLIERLGEGFDVVVGSRYVAGGSIPAWSWHRRLISRVGNVYAATLLGLSKMTDLTSGFRAYRGEILRRIDVASVTAESYAFQIEMVHRAVLAGGKVTEIPIRFVDRVEGRSKMSLFTIIEALGLVTLWGLRRLFRRERRALGTRSSGGTAGPA